MPITYSYEGPLAQPAYRQAVQAGFGLGAADAARFSAQQQLAYNQMAQQRAMNLQRMIHDRWMGALGHQQSMQRIAAQGNVNQALAQDAQQNRLKELQLRSQYRTAEDENHWQMRQRYQEEIMDKTLNQKGEALRREVESRMQMVREMHERGDLSDSEFRAAEFKLMDDALGMGIGREQIVDGEPKTMIDTQYGQYWIPEEGPPEPVGTPNRPVQQAIENGDLLPIEMSDGSIAGWINTTNRGDYQAVTNPAAKLELDFRKHALDTIKEQTAQKIEAWKIYMDLRSEMLQQAEASADPIEARRQVQLAFPNYASPGAYARDHMPEYSQGQDAEEEQQEPVASLAERRQSALANLLSRAINRGLDSEKAKLEVERAMELPFIATARDAKRLPSGTRFLGVDGRIYTKK